jgi:hypothetical protein
MEPPRPEKDVKWKQDTFIKYIFLFSSAVSSALSFEVSQKRKNAEFDADFEMQKIHPKLFVGRKLLHMV